MLSGKELFKQEVNYRLQQYLLSDQTEPYYHCVSGRLPWVMYSEQDETYTRERTALGENKHALDVIKKDGDFDHLIWRTSSANIEKAVDNGLLSFESMTSKVISKLGHYRTIACKRLYDHGLVSNKYHAKDTLIGFTQARVKALQSLEQLVNNYNTNLIPQKNREQLVIALNIYKSNLELLMGQYNQAIRAHLLQYDRNALTTMQHFIDNDRARADRLITQLNSVKEDNLEPALQSFLNVKGPKSLGAFIKENMIGSIREIQGINQNITYSRKAKSLLRGDFNSVCEDGLVAISDYKPDLHNPILPEHQGRFSHDPDKPYAVSLKHLGSDQTKIEEALMAICQIEGKDKLTISDDEASIHKLDGTSHPLKVSRFLKWRINATAGHHLKRTGVWLINIATGLFIGFTYDLFVGLAAGMSGHKLPSLAKKLYIKLENPAKTNTSVERLSGSIDKKYYSLGTLVGLKIRTFCRNVLFDIIQGTKATFQRTTFELWNDLVADFKTRESRKASKEQVLDELATFLKDLTEKKKKLHQEVINITPLKDREIGVPTALTINPVYHLNPGEWMDLTNSMVKAVRFIFETFTNPIHAKHPTAGLIFSTFYLTGLFSIMAPKMMATILPKGYITFSDKLAGSMANTTFAKGVGTAITQAELFAAGFEAILHGNESWLADAGRMFESDPADMVVYLTLAVGMGYLIAFEFHIPYLSKTISEDLGTVPANSLAFAGAKITLLLYHFLEEKKQDPTNDKVPEIRSELKKILETVYHDREVTGGKKEELIDKTITELLSDKVLSSIPLLSKAGRKKEAFGSDLEKIRLLQQIESNKEMLPDLSSSLKRQLLREVKTMFPKDNDTYQTIHDLLYPPPTQSIFVVTLTTIVDYVPLLLRCLLTPVTWTSKPFEEMAFKTRKDLTRVANAASNAVHGAFSFIRVAFRGVFDILGNEMAARAEGLVYGDRHTIADSNYKLTRLFDVNVFEHGSEVFGEPTNKLKKVTTHSVCHSIFKKHTGQFMEKHQPHFQSEAPADSLRIR